MAHFSGVCTFYLGSGGGHRLWLDGQLILDSCKEHYPGLFPAKPINLVAGQLYDIKLEYFNTDAKTGMGLIWQSTSMPQEYIPHSQLFTGDVTSTPTAPTTNQSPVANAGADITITLPTNSATLKGTASADPDGTITASKVSYVSEPTAGSPTD